MPQKLIAAIADANRTCKDYLADRITVALEDVAEKVFTCDLFGAD